MAPDQVVDIFGRLWSFTPVGRRHYVFTRNDGAARIVRSAASASRVFFRCESHRCAVLARGNIPMGRNPKLCREGIMWDLIVYGDRMRQKTPEVYRPTLRRLGLLKKLPYNRFDS